MTANDNAEIIARETDLIYNRRPQELSWADWEFLKEQGIINGCGSKTGPFANFRPPDNKFFEANCDWHDHGYKKGGDALRKVEVDCKFFAAMVRDIWRNRMAWYKKPYFWTWSLAYFLAVSLFAWPAYSLHSPDEKL